MKTSILMTVHDREPEVLLATLRALRRSGASSEDVEIVIANDRSEMTYEWLIEYACRWLSVVWVKVPAYDAFRLPGGHNGPSRAFNEALRASSGERIVVMSSDIIVTPGAFRAMLAHDVDEGMWTPKVWDIDGRPFREYCGPSRIFPMPWFLLASRRALMEVGGWDEEYLLGLSFDDNDIAARVGLYHGKFFVDFDQVVFHQSHDPVSPGNAAHETNRKYTKEKWQGIPFDGENTPFDVSRRPHPSGRMVFECKAKKELLARVVGLTRGMFEKAKT